LHYEARDDARLFHLSEPTSKPEQTLSLSSDPKKEAEPVSKTLWFEMKNIHIIGSETETTYPIVVML
jgi:hypothetical protein